jgi:hypothetical protein
MAFSPPPSPVSPKRIVIGKKKKNQLNTNGVPFGETTLGFRFLASFNIISQQRIVTNMLQAGRSRVRFPMRSLDFSIDSIFPAALWLEMSTRNLPRGKGRPVRKADNLTAICELIV